MQKYLIIPNMFLKLYYELRAYNYSILFKKDILVTIENIYGE